MNTKINETLVYSELLGDYVSNYSEEWRHECECRAILSMPDKASRNRYIDGITENGKTVRRGIARVRGQAAAQRLREDCIKLFNIRKTAQESKDNG